MKEEDLDEIRDCIEEAIESALSFLMVPLSRADR